MSLTMAILMLIAMWASVALAMLWGVMRILRRHASLPPRTKPRGNLPKATPH
ncbi:hypothetical protein [Pseudomonas sp. UBA6562]|uniref:hypothetical protein n=1 Tax=Pseudomonas sp. UBA6562 TaxID=1947332 RepID=UPI0025E2A2B1|nr:hypothetical protein [Pseudomonas sp. UBA6562]